MASLGTETPRGLRASSTSNVPDKPVFDAKEIGDLLTRITSLAKGPDLVGLSVFKPAVCASISRSVSTANCPIKISCVLSFSIKILAYYIVTVKLNYQTSYQPVSSNNSRPISQRRISLVPAPIS